MAEKRGIDTIYASDGSKVTVKQDSGGGIDFAVDGDIVYFLKVKEINYLASNKEEALNQSNNPTIIFGKSTMPYCIIFKDNVGDSMFGGGTSCIFGYQYADDRYGVQLDMKYNERLRIRYKNEGKWGSWNNVTIS